MFRGESLLKKCFEGKACLRNVSKGIACLRNVSKGKACLRNLWGCLWPPLLPNRTPPVTPYHPLRGAYYAPPRRLQEASRAPPRELQQRSRGGLCRHLGPALGPGDPQKRKTLKGEKVREKISNLSP